MSLKNPIKTIGLITGLLLLTGVAFYPSIGNDFTNLDDPNYLLHNPLIQDLSLEGIQNIFNQFHSGLYKPLTLLSFAVEYHFFELNPLIYHLTNLILHLLNTLLVYIFLYLLCGKRSVSFIAALLFGIHPLHVESVAWVSERKDVMCSFFYLSSLVCYMNYLKESKPLHRLGVLIFFIASLITKPMALTLPFVLGLIDIIKKRPLSIKSLLEKTFILSIAFFIAIINFLASQIFRLEMNLPVFTYSIENILIICYAPIFYLTKLLFPTHLSAIYPLPSDFVGYDRLLYVISPLILIGIAGYIYMNRKNHTLLFGSVFFILILIPVIQIVRYGPSIVSDRYAYLSSIGPFFIVAYLYHAVTRRYEKFKYVFYLFGGVIVLVLVFMTQSQCKVWANGVTLWTSAIQHHPRHALAYLNRGRAYYSQEAYDDAMRDVSKGISLAPKDIDAYYRFRAEVFFRRKQYSEALKDLTTVLHENPTNYKYYVARGDVFIALKNTRAALRDYENAVFLRPRDVRLLTNRANLYLDLRDCRNALRDYQKVIELDPEASMFQRNYEIALSVCQDNQPID